MGLRVSFGWDFLEVLQVGRNLILNTVKAQYSDISCNKKSVLMGEVVCF